MDVRRTSRDLSRGIRDGGKRCCLQHARGRGHRAVPGLAGIALFLGYTAYDVSKVRENYYFYAGQGELLKKASIFSALQLYLDFINLFLYILRILGNRKD